jgi:TPR repeat protein
MMKLTGKGTTKDSKEAKEWFLQAANNGDGLAQRLLDQYKSLF